MHRKECNFIIEKGVALIPFPCAAHTHHPADDLGSLTQSRDSSWVSVALKIKRLSSVSALSLQFVPLCGLTKALQASSPLV